MSIHTNIWDSYEYICEKYAYDKSERGTTQRKEGAFRGQEGQGRATEQGAMICLCVKISERNSTSLYS